MGPRKKLARNGNEDTKAKDRARRPRQPFVLSDGLAPVPAKLVARILRGDFVDMAELLRDNLEAQRQGVIQESSAILSDLKRCRREIPDLLSWVQCSGTYMAVRSQLSQRSSWPTKPSLSKRPGGVVVGAGWHMTRYSGSRPQAIRRWIG